MRSLDNDTVVVAAGFAVLFVSLAFPLLSELANKHEVRQVATRAIEFKDEVLSSDEPGKVIQARVGALQSRVGDLMSGLAPDAALAEVTDVAMPIDGLVAPAAPGRGDQSLATALAPPPREFAVASEGALDGEDSDARTAHGASWTWSAK